MNSSKKPACEPAGKSQPETSDDGIVRWPDGTKKSTDNAFTTPYGVPIGKTLEDYARARKRTTKTHERLQAEGRDGSTIHGLSKRSDVLIRRQRERERATP